MTTFNEATFDRILKRIHAGEDMFTAAEGEGHTHREMMEWIVAHRATGGADHHPSIYLARAAYLERHALRLADELADYAKTERIRAGTVAAEWRAVIDRLLDEARRWRELGGRMASFAAINITQGADEMPEPGAEPTAEPDAKPAKRRRAKAEPTPEPEPTPPRHFDPFVGGAPAPPATRRRPKNNSPVPHRRIGPPSCPSPSLREMMETPPAKSGRDTGTPGQLAVYAAKHRAGSRSMPNRLYIDARAGRAGGGPSTLSRVAPEKGWGVSAAPATMRRSPVA